MGASTDASATSGTQSNGQLPAHTGHLYVARLLTDGAMDQLRRLGYPLVVGGEAPPTREDLLAGIAGAVGAVMTLTERVDHQVLVAAGPQLRVVANVAVGYDNIDVQAANRAGVTVTNTPGVLDQASADHAFALILTVCRRVTEGDRLIRSGQQWVWGPRMLVGLDISAGATLGIIGYGRIGQAVARRARAFGMQVVATSGSRVSGVAADGTAFLPLPELLAASEVVSIHTPLTAATRHLIDADAIAAMKPTAYLINTARGGVVDETALIAALRSNRLRGAALDVFEGEPQVNPGLLTLDNVVLTPHTASAGEATRDAMGLLAARNVAAVLAGDAPITPVG
jgi:lactate dehydrogenase-like 2-hydroxyacid dehydrogenase